MQAFVTGATGGLGRAIAVQLADAGYAVTGAGRHPARLAELAAAGIRPLAVDLSSPEGCRVVVEQLEQAADLAVVVHAAGIWPHRREITSQGWELAFAVNHLAPFRINAGAAPVVRAQDARIVQLGAGLAVRGAIDVRRTPTGRDFGPIRSYTNTKLWNALATFEWSQREPGLAICSIHPGVVRTALGDRSGALGWLLRRVKNGWLDPQQAARGPVTLATATHAPAGEFFDKDATSPLEVPHRDRQREVFAATLAMMGR